MASNESPTTAQRLQARLQALTERFATLASVLREDAIPLLELGVAPDQAIAEELVAACIEYHARVSEAKGMGLTDEAGPELGELLRQLDNITSQQAWNVLRESLLNDARRSLNIRHTGGANPEFLQKLHQLAAECIAQLEAPSTPVEVDHSQLENRVQPLRNVLCILDEVETMSDREAGRMLDLVEEEFGRHITTSIVTRRLVVADPALASSTCFSLEPTGDPEEPDAANAAIPAVAPPRHQSRSPRAPTCRARSQRRVSTLRTPPEHRRQPITNPMYFRTVLEP